MRIPEKFLETLRSRLTLSEIIGQKVKLTRKGREHTGLCPFHHEKTPSFTVNDQKEFYHCFGCGAHGDAVKFLMEAQNYSFLEAVSELAGKCGLPLPQGEGLSSLESQKEDTTPLKKCIEEAVLWFQKNLFHAKGSLALQYATKRGLSRETLKKFSLGYAPDHHHALELHLKDKGFKEDDLIKSGLLVQKAEGGNPYDRFRSRLMFPIYDHRGSALGFGARLLERGEPKYLNSPETPLFSKGKLLYGYHLAKERPKGEPLLFVEGYMDVISLHQNGFHGAVAPLGTALTEDQIYLAWRLDPEPILCFDGDAAGLKAAARAAERVLPLLKPGHSLRFVYLPQGEDPDSLVRKGTALQDLLTRPHSLLDSLWIFATYAKSFDSPERKAALQKQCAIWTQAIQNSDIRKNYHYAFKDLFYKNIINKKTKNPVISSLKKGKINFLLIYERLLLAILVNHPNLIGEASDELASIDFDEPRHHELKDALLQYYADEGLDKTDVKDYLFEKGFESEVVEILSSQVLLHGAFAKPSASLEDAREGWKEIFKRTQIALGRNDLKDAQESLATEMSEKAWKRLKTLKENTLIKD